MNYSLFRYAIRVQPKDLLARTLSIQSCRRRWADDYADPILPQEQEQDPSTSEQLAYTPIRPAPIRKSSSVFYDKLYERFLLLLLRKGDLAWARERMERSFYEIKLTQLSRLNKARAKATANEENGDQKSDTKAEDICVDPLQLFHKAIENCKPIVVTKPVQRGGATYQVPYPITPEHSEFRGIKWLIETVVDRPKPKRKHFHQAMSREILEAANNDGRTVKRKQDVHRQAEANKTYAHYRWG